MIPLTDRSTVGSQNTAAPGAPASRRRRFLLILIKPSHYDDDGYVIQWLRSVMPSNSLASLYGLARDAAERRVLGDDVDIEVIPIDETNTRVKPARLIAAFARNGQFGMVGLVGVQSNQFARALDIAAPLRAAGVPVVIGGFHVSGSLAMLSETQPDLQAALNMGISLFAGEAEDRLDRLLLDVASGSLAPIYNYLNDLPAISGAPIPFLQRNHVRKTVGTYSTFDAGRGCPYQCSFCTIINVQGRKSRRRSPDDVEHIVRQNWPEGIRRFFITDDNLARNKDWEAIFDRLIRLREEEGMALDLMIQVDTLCHKIPKFVEKAARAGVREVAIGVDSINPRTLLAAKKRQNKIAEYRSMLLAWKRVGVITYANYILGFPDDTTDSIREDIEIIKAELPVDLVVFYLMTPLPGSEDHQTLWRQGVWMDPDLNRYDTEHAVTAHPRMSREESEQIYRAAWDLYYTPEHCETVMRRAAACNIDPGSMSAALRFFVGFTRLEKVHPLQGGLIRFKYRADRRPGSPIQPVWRFYPDYARETVTNLLRRGRIVLRLDRLRRSIEKDPNRRAYTDRALTLVDSDADPLRLLTRDRTEPKAFEVSEQARAG